MTSYWWPNLEEFSDQWTDDVKSEAFLQVNGPLTKKTWGWGWVVLVVKTKTADISLVSRVKLGEIIGKNKARTARRQLEGRHNSGAEQP